MTEAILEAIKTDLEKVCPFEVRLSHSGNALPKDRPVIILSGESITSDIVQCEGIRTRYAVTAEISVKTCLPFRYGISELRRITAACIMPVMAKGRFSIAGFSESSAADSISEGVHISRIKFRIKGVYTAFTEENT